MKPSKTVSDQKLRLRWASACNGIAEKALLQGIRIDISGGKLNILEGAPIDKVRAAVEALEFYESVLPVKAVALTAPEESRLLKKALKRLGYGPHPCVKGDFADYFEHGNIIEVYDQSHVQIYRNLEFFRHCGYTLLELSLMDWQTLYERPKQIEMLIQQKIGEALQGRIIGGGAIPEHTLSERYLKSKRTFLIDIKWGLPLVHDESPDHFAYMSVLNARLVATGQDGSKITPI